MNCNELLTESRLETGFHRISYIESPMKDPITATTLVLEIPCNVSGECNSTWRPPWMGCSYALFAFLSAHGRKIHEYPECKVD